MRRYIYVYGIYVRNIFTAHQIKCLLDWVDIQYILYIGSGDEKEKKKL